MKTKIYHSFALTLLFLCASASFAQPISVKPYKEPASLLSFREAMDTVKTAVSMISVAKNFQQKYPDEISVQMLAANLLAQDNLDATRNYYVDRAANNPDDQAAIYLAGRLSEKSEDQKLYSQKLLDKKPDNYWGLILRASSYTDSEDSDYKRAEADLRKAISVDNSLPFAVEALGLLLQRKGNKDDADAVFVKLQEMQPNRFAALQYRLMLAGDDYEKGGKLTDEFLKNNPKDLNALNVKAGIARELKDWKSYVETNRKIVANEKNNVGESAYNLACAYSLSGEKDSAFVYLNKSAENGFNDIEQFKSDEDLIPLRDDARWADLLVNVEKSHHSDMAAMAEQMKKTAPERKEKAIEERLNSEAPDWSFKDLSGKTVSLAGLRGKVVVIDFWATWCGPCKMTMPLIDKFYSEKKSKDVEVFGINVWERNGTDNVKPFIEGKGYKFPILLGDTDITQKYGVRGIPTLFVIDKEGKIAYKHVGYDPTIDEVLDWQTKELLK